MCLEFHNPWGVNRENYHGKRQCSMRRSISLMVKNAEMIVFSLFFYFFHSFAVPGEFLDIWTMFFTKHMSFLYVKNCNFCQFVPQMAKHDRTCRTVDYFRWFFHFFQCQTWISRKNTLPNMLIYHDKNVKNASFSFFFKKKGLRERDTCFYKKKTSVFILFIP